MKSLFSANISATIVYIFCFVQLFRDALAFTASTGNAVSGRCRRLCAKQSSDGFSIGSSSLPTADKKGRVKVASDSFLKEYFQSDIDDINLPPSMSIIHRSIGLLASGSDVRGKFVKHPATGRMAALARSIGQTPLPALTPFAAHCLGFAFATMIKEYQQLQGKEDEETIICIGRDPRQHGLVLADSFARGAGGLKGVKVLYTGIATTPALFEFCRYAITLLVCLLFCYDHPGPFSHLFLFRLQN
jgi:hypothetical protein